MLEKRRYRVRVPRRPVDDIFRGDAIEIVRTPCRAPQANGVASRFVRSVRTECLNSRLVLNQTRVETFRADRTHEPRGNPVGLRRATRCPNDLNRVASEYVINWPPRDSNP